MFYLFVWCKGIKSALTKNDLNDRVVFLGLFKIQWLCGQLLRLIFWLEHWIIPLFVFKVKNILFEVVHLELEGKVIEVGLTTLLIVRYRICQ